MISRFLRASTSVRIAVLVGALAPLLVVRELNAQAALTVPAGLPDWAFNIPDKIQPTAVRPEGVVKAPGSAKEYTRDDFARDLYLLDKSGVTRMDNGIAFRFSASTGTRNLGSTFVCIAEDGSEKRYYGIDFSKAGEADR